MTPRTRMLITAGVAGALIVLAVWAIAGPPEPLPTPPGTFAFAALGDAPYLPWEDAQYRILTRDLDAHDLALVVHIGDIFWRPCTDEHYREARGRLDALAHPVFYTPGDNEWADCWEKGSGGFAPLERLDSIRRIFFDEPRRSFGRRSIPAESQADDAEFPTFRENVRWRHDGVVFATVHLVGSRNAREPYPGSGKRDDDAASLRTEAAAAWVRSTFAAARESGAPAVVVAFHAEPGFEDRSTAAYREAFEPFLTELESEVERFGGPVLVVHGDEHKFIVDRPIGARNLTRLEVPGSPRVGWVRVVVDTKARDPFSFDERVVPRWKYW